LIVDRAVRGAVLESVWSARFEHALPVRRLAAWKGQRHLRGGQRRPAGIRGLSRGGSLTLLAFVPEAEVTIAK
jgi:hypothetical protein